VLLLFAQPERADNRASDLRPAMGRRLDRVGIVARLGANHAQVDDVKTVLEGDPQDGVVEGSQAGSQDADVGLAEAEEL
jgi:hypothetical protein